MTFLSGFVSDCMIDYAWVTCRLVPFFLNWDIYTPLTIEAVHLINLTVQIILFKKKCKTNTVINYVYEKIPWTQVSFLYLQSRDSIAPLQPLLRCKRSHWARNLNRYGTWRWNNARHFSLFYRKKKQKLLLAEISTQLLHTSQAYRRLKKISTKGSSMIGSNQSREYNQTWRRQERKAVSWKPPTNF